MHEYFGEIQHNLQKRSINSHRYAEPWLPWPPLSPTVSSSRPRWQRSDLTCRPPQVPPELVADQHRPSGWFLEKVKFYIKVVKVQIRLQQLKLDILKLIIEKFYGRTVEVIGLRFFCVCFLLLQIIDKNNKKLTFVELVYQAYPMWTLHFVHQLHTLEKNIK